MGTIFETAAAPRAAIGSPGAFVRLTKPKGILPHLVTTGAAMFLAAGGAPPVSALVFTLLGGGCVAAAANTLNCVLDRDLDALMERTRERPLPAGRLRPGHGLSFAAVLGLGGTAILASFVNAPAAALALIALVYYVAVYTLWLKRRTRWSSVAGSAIGGIPPLIGWVAVTDRLAWTPALLSAIIILWTFPHFWALVFLRHDEYAGAGIPALPRKGAGVWIAVSTLLLVAVSLLLAPAAGLGSLYVASACLLGAPLLGLAARFNRPDPESAARRLFAYSIVYLAVLFVAMIVDRVTPP